MAEPGAEGPATWFICEKMEGAGAIWTAYATLCRRGTLSAVEGPDKTGKKDPGRLRVRLPLPTRPRVQLLDKDKRPDESPARPGDGK